MMWSVCTCPHGYKPKGRVEGQRLTVCYSSSSKENARLIAAAPAMLAALEWAVESADADQYEQCWYASARAAIDAAKKGEQP